jgi:hypothetical protein
VKPDNQRLIDLTGVALDLLLTTDASQRPHEVGGGFRSTRAEFRLGAPRSGQACRAACPRAPTSAR